MFQEYSTEYELLTKYYESYEKGESLTSSDIKVYLDKESGLKLSPSKLNNELKKLNFIQERINENGIYKVVYRVRFKDNSKYSTIINQPF